MSATNALTKVRAVFNVFQKIDETMPLQIANTFVTVALYEGRSLREYCDISGAAQSTMSRHLLDLGERNRQKEPGFGLVEYRSDPNDLRRNVYKLTPKGKRVLSDLVSAVESGHA